MTRWCIYDTHGDVCFKSERLEFDSFKEMIEHINNNDDLLDRLEHNWAIIYPGRYNVSMLDRALICTLIELGMIEDKEKEKCSNTEE